MKLAAQKQHEPIVVEVKPKTDEGPLLTKKQKMELEREKQCRGGKLNKNPVTTKQNNKNIKATPFHPNANKPPLTLDNKSSHSSDLNHKPPVQSVAILKATASAIPNYSRGSNKTKPEFKVPAVKHSQPIPQLTAVKQQNSSSQKQSIGSSNTIRPGTSGGHKMPVKPVNHERGSNSQQSAAKKSVTTKHDNSLNSKSSTVAASREAFSKKVPPQPSSTKESKLKQLNSSYNVKDYFPTKNPKPNIKNNRKYSFVFITTWNPPSCFESITIFDNRFMPTRTFYCT